MKAGRTLQELAIELDRQANAKRDLIVDTGALHMDVIDDGRIALNLGTSDYHESFDLNDIAHRQFGQYLKIPAPYYDRMRAEFPDLLTRNVNGWLAKEPENRRMLRTLDGTARAFLSDRYRRIDNYEVAQSVLPIIGNMDGASVESCELTDSKMYIKVVNQRITAEIAKGDIVQAGIVITNSEVGYGSVSVRPLIYRLVCTNGMIAEDGSIRKYHVGRANEADDNFNIYRDETIEADDRAFLMKIEDAVSAAVDQARFNSIVSKLRESREAKIDPPAVPKVVELTAKEYSITQAESEGILGHLIAGGDLSLYGLANAVTRHAHDVDSYDRSTDLETTGYKIATMSPALWRQLTKV
jgi:hypothetical protein